MPTLRELWAAACDVRRFAEAYIRSFSRGRCDVTILAHGTLCPGASEIAVQTTLADRAALRLMLTEALCQVTLADSLALQPAPAAPNAEHAAYGAKS
jgi:hypothetical protein